MSMVAQSVNPHKGYRGNIDGGYGSTDDYGVYADGRYHLRRRVAELHDWLSLHDRLAPAKKFEGR